MKKVWILSTLIGIVLGVVGYVTSQVVIMQRPLSSQGLSAGVGYGTRVPVVTDDGRPPTDGELFVVRNAGTSEPVLSVYSALAGDWLEVITSDNSTSQTLDGDIVFGTNDVDDITFNGPVTYNVFREDFDFVVAQHMEEDFTAAVLTDGGQNLIIMPNSQLGVIAWVTESSDGLSAAPAFFDAQGLMSFATATDDIDNDAALFIFGAFGQDQVNAQHDAVWFDEDTGNSVYCEASINMTDISDTDDVWFGWAVKEAADNPPASATYNTYAFFTVSDLAGDLDIETALNGGAAGNDDTGTTLADASGTQIYRVTLSADTVSFTLNGTAVTQTNALLDLDAADEAVCVFGYTLVATSDPTFTIDYVEIGVSQ